MTLSCQDIAVLASRSLEQQLEPEQERTLATHLGDCAGCREALALAGRIATAAGLQPEDRRAAPRREAAIRLVAQASRRDRSLLRRMSIAVIAGPILTVVAFMADSWLWQPLLGVAIYAALMLAWSGYRLRSLARLGAGDEDLMATIERSLRRRLRISGPATAFTLVVGALWFATGFVELPASMRSLGFRNVGMLGPVTAIAFAGLAIYELRVVRARLSRELELLAER